ncbi:MAG: hypothetical protein CM15mP98_05150 [Paracoccaceae bacterium]|nr:MAG: hypothetical protein CM15mP98_05150 [Paracoccaceae bacterium]
MLKQLNPQHGAVENSPFRAISFGTKVYDDQDILVFDGGNTHFWSEIAVNIAGSNGLTLSQIMHPGSYSMLGVGVSFALSAKRLNKSKTVVLISGDGAF